MDPYLEQEKLEREMLDFSKLEFHKKLFEARDKEREGDTVYGSIAFNRSLIPTFEAIKEWLAKARASPAGRLQEAEHVIERLGLELETLAFLTCRVVVDRLSRPSTFQSVAIQLGSMAEDEARARQFETEFPDVISRLEVKVRDSSTYTRRKAILSSVAGKLGLAWRALTPKEHLVLGSMLIGLFSTATGLVKIVQIRGEKHGGSKLVPTPECLAWIENTIARNEIMAPFKWPMVVPPLPWNGPWTGGYLSLDPIRTPIPFVKVRNKGFMKRLEDHKMPEVYRAVNIMQDTPYKVNTKILEVFKEFWSNSLELAGLPSRQDRELPPRPDNIAENDEARREWSRRASKVHRWNETTRSKRVQIAKTLWLAEKFKDYPSIYFPYQADFRGRLYCVPGFLNPQGPDYARAMLLFARGKPLGDGDGPGWLAVHIANCFGVDKVTFDDRIRWVEENEDKILEAARDPLNYRWWCEADDPWLFLAGCFEWQGYKEQGGAYVCHLPVTMDGSCNGLQHFSAMLRDPVGGAAVNLTPSQIPADVYGAVAEVVTKRLGELDDDNARKWLEIGITRKITKRPVMVLPYGGTRQSMSQYIEESLDEIVKTRPNPWQDGDNPKTFQAAVWLTPTVWSSINEVVVAARSAMDWLQKVGNILAKEGQSIEWVTPDGFLAQQSYRKQVGDRVELRLIDRKRLTFRLNKESDKLDSRKQASGISPNFVHSMDAAALRLYVLTAIENGIDNFMVIHDSYGCLPSDVSMMGACLRHAFVDMYEENNVLEQFRQRALMALPEDKHDLIPPVPPMGTLDLQQVKQSDYFFA